MSAAWFSALGRPLAPHERAEAVAYLSGLALDPVAGFTEARTWEEAGALCSQPAQAWWAAEERERDLLERSVRLDPADPEWLRLNETLREAAEAAAARFGCADPALVRVAAGAAAYGAHQARLAHAAGAPPTHPFLRKYQLYCAGHWPLGVYGDRFAIF